MKFSLMTYTMIPLMRTGEMNLEDVIKFASKENFEAIELLMLNYKSSSEDIKKLLEKYDMKISCIDGFIDLAVDNEKDYIKNIQLGKFLVDKAVELTSPMVMIVPALVESVKGESDKERVVHNIIKGLKSLVAYANEKDIILTIENFPNLLVPLCSISEMEAILEEVPHLKLTFDSGNMIVAGDDTLEAYDRLWKYTVNAHVKDWGISNDDKDTLCADGRYLKAELHDRGIVNHELLFESMIDKGYHGYLAFEYEGLLNSAEATRIGIKHLREVLNNVKINQIKRSV